MRWHNITKLPVTVLGRAENIYCLWRPSKLSQPVPPHDSTASRCIVSAILKIRFLFISVAFLVRSRTRYFDGSFWRVVFFVVFPVTRTRFVLFGFFVCTIHLLVRGSLSFVCSVFMLVGKRPFEKLSVRVACIPVRDRRCRSHSPPSLYNPWQLYRMVSILINYNHILIVVKVIFIYICVCV